MSLEDAFASFPVLTTRRMRLRQMRTTDAPAVHAFKSDLEVTKHYGQEPHRSIDQTRAWIQRREDDYGRRETIFWVFALAGEDTAIGSSCFWNFDSGFHCAEIGYELHPAYWRQGLMSEALSAVLTYGFDELGLHRIEANPLAGNESSVKLLRKLGFTYEGCLRQRHFYRGNFGDQLYFGILKDEWTKPP